MKTAIVKSRTGKSLSLVKCSSVYRTPSGGYGIKYTPADGAFQAGGFKTEAAAKAHAAKLGATVVWPVSDGELLKGKTPNEIRNQSG